MSDREDENNPVKQTLSRGIFLVPTVLTLLNMLLGFYAILMAFQHEPVLSGIAIVAAFLLDGLDGRIARMTDNVSEFGVELDSLADMVSFGLAPSVLAFNLWLAAVHYHLGMLVAFLFASGAAMRLARFNAYDRRGERLKYFNGLPSPCAAGAVVALVFLEQRLLPGLGPVPANFTLTYLYLAPLIVVLLSYLMLSSRRYPSFKNLGWFRHHPWPAAALGVVFVVLVVLVPMAVVVVLFLAYLVLGFVPGAWEWGLDPDPAG